MQEAGTQSNAELKGSEATEIAEHIPSSMGAPQKRKRTVDREAKPKPVETQEQKDFKEKKVARTTAIRKLKSAIDKGRADAITLSKDCEKLKAKYPEPMVSYFENKIKTELKGPPT